MWKRWRYETDRKRKRRAADFYGNTRKNSGSPQGEENAEEGKGFGFIDEQLNKDKIMDEKLEEERGSSDEDRVQYKAQIHLRKMRKSWLDTDKVKKNAKQDARDERTTSSQEGRRTCLYNH